MSVSAPTSKLPDCEISKSNGRRTFRRLPPTSRVKDPIHLLRLTARPTPRHLPVAGFRVEAPGCAGERTGVSALHERLRGFGGGLHFGLAFALGLFAF